VPSLVILMTKVERESSAQDTQCKVGIKNKWTTTEHCT